MTVTENEIKLKKGQRSKKKRSLGTKLTTEKSEKRKRGKFGKKTNKKNGGF